MPNIKNPAYLYVPPDLDHPAAGKTIEVEMEEFKKNAKEWKSYGIRPATGKELDPIQRGMERKIASESPGTAAAVGGLRGATFGLSDVALTKSGIADPQALKTLRDENPKASMAAELAGGLASGGAALKGAGMAASSVPSLLGRQAIAGAAVGGLTGAGQELSEQTLQDEGFDVGNIATSGLAGAALGGALPVAGRGLGTAASKVKEAGLRGVQKGAGLVRGVAQQAQKATAMGSPGQQMFTDMATAVAGAPGLRPGVQVAAPKLSQAASYVQRAAGTQLNKQAQRREIAKLARQLRDRNPNLSGKDAKALVEKLQERAAQLQSNPLGGTATAMGATQKGPNPVAQQFRDDLRALGQMEASAENPFQALSQDEIVDLLKRQQLKNVADKEQAARAVLDTMKG